VDTEGARALAERIAAGQPRNGDEREPPDRPATFSRKAAEGSSVETVYIRPHPVRRADLRVYVRGADGSLERFNV